VHSFETKLNNVTFNLIVQMKDGCKVIPFSKLKLHQLKSSQNSVLLQVHLFTELKTKEQF